MKIKRFAQSLTKHKNHYPIPNQKYTFWYETEEGKKIDCSESKVDILWRTWLVSEGVKKYEKEGFTVFEFGEEKEIL